MALTKTITAGKVTEDRYGDVWKVPITLTIFDDSVQVHSKSWSISHKTGQGTEPKIKALKVSMDAEIAKYKREKVIENSNALPSALSWLDTNVEV